MLTLETLLVALSGGIDDMICKEFVFNSGFIAVVTSDFLFGHLFKLNFSKTMEYTNIKSGTIDHHFMMNVIRGVIMLQLKMSLANISFLDLNQSQHTTCQLEKLPLFYDQ